MKFSVSRLLETARYLKTKVGQEVPDFFNYMADFVDNTARCLRNGLTFADNVACEVKTVSLSHDTSQLISASKPVTGIIPLRVVSTRSGIASFSWFYDEGGRLTVKAGFTGTPTTALDVVLVLLF